MKRAGTSGRTTAAQATGRLAVDELHDQEGAAVGVADVVQGDDAGMVERARGLRLAQQPRLPAGVALDLARQQLERHLAAQPLIDRAIDLAHRAAAERADDAVMRELHRWHPAASILWPAHPIS